MRKMSRMVSTEKSQGICDISRRAQQALVAIFNCPAPQSQHCRHFALLVGVLISAVDSNLCT